MPWPVVALVVRTVHHECRGLRESAASAEIVTTTPTQLRGLTAAIRATPGD
ncbi:hypothetical protein ACH492_16205 [Streptomyces sp. NPDC019443]|uniref:hypothetical protein n=1 Tax=Streptomyces sp. NPDC019443 TaxID=3365061 RepID=UPI0037BE16E3